MTGALQGRLNSMLRKILRFILLVPVALIVVPFLLWSTFKILGTIAAFKVPRWDPVSHLHYDMPLHLLIRPRFQLFTREVSKEDVPVKPLRYEDQLAEQIKRDVSRLSVSEPRETTQGFTYVFVQQERCFLSHEKSVDPDANVGKAQIECTGNLGSEQDLFYVFVDEKVFEFTTGFPTRIILNDASFKRMPEKISEQDFQTLIDSLKK